MRWLLILLSLLILSGCYSRMSVPTSLGQIDTQSGNKIVAAIDEDPDGERTVFVLVRFDTVDDAIEGMKAVMGEIKEIFNEGVK